MPEAPNPNDYAIVVGITHYPGLMGEDRKPRSLEGPVNDANAIRAWLVDPDGGGLDPAKVHILCSPAAAPASAAEATPNRADLDNAFKWIVKETAINTPRRLYVYMSGHGFSPDFNQACLLTANFEPEWLENIHTTEWVNSLIKCKRFQEYVLWLDCCMVSMPIVPGSVSMPRCPAQGEVPPQMLAFATQSGLKACEFKIPADNDRVHGAFTWALVQGLRTLGRVDAETLKAHILNDMKNYFPAEYQDVPDYAANPRVDVLPQTPSGQLVFGCARASTMRKVTFDAPAIATGKNLQVWGGIPAAVAGSKRFDAATLNLQLERGIYVAEVVGAGIRQGFEVTGTSDVTVKLDEQGPPVSISQGASPRLSIEADSPAATITLVNTSFDKVAQTTGYYGGRQPSGVYKIRVQYGHEVANVSERILLLDRDQEGIKIAGPRVVSPVPLDGTAFTHEYHVQAAAGLAGRPRKARERASSRTASIAVLARYWTGNPPAVREASRFPHPFDGLSLWTRKGRKFADLATLGDVMLQSVGGLDPVATCRIELEPDTYLLRQMLPKNRTHERSVVACRGWCTELFIQRSNLDLDAGSKARARSMGEVSVLMARPGDQSWRNFGERPQTQVEKSIEIARIALAAGRPILKGAGEGNGELERLLLAKFTNPMAGIIGALLLLTEVDESKDEAKRNENIRTLNEVVANLRRVVGDNHPDVEAISLRCSDAKLHNRKTLSMPPMFAKSWAVALEAMRDGKGAADAVWNRVKARVADPLYLVWAKDQGTRAVYEERLTEVVRSTLKAGKGKAKQDQLAALAAFAPPSQIQRITAGGNRAASGKPGRSRGLRTEHTR